MRVLVLTVGFFAATFFSGNVNSQGSGARVAQELIARLDQALVKSNLGLIKANLILIRRSGETASWDVSIFRKDDDTLYLFESRGRGLEYKILIKDGGEQIYVFNVLSKKIFRKVDEEKYEQHLATGFSFMDLSGVSYQANYNPIVQSDLKAAEQSFKRVSLKPIIPYFYSKLILLLELDSLKPTRLDFHDRDGVLFKTMNIKYGPLKVKQNQKIAKEDHASRLEMLDLNTGSISVLEYTEIDKEVKPDPSLFDLANLNR
ncbi:outer membrane lipoprotein-sorting protein [Leptospira sp. WS92.C1]